MLNRAVGPRFAGTWISGWTREKMVEDGSMRKVNPFFVALFAGFLLLGAGAAGSATEVAEGDSRIMKADEPEYGELNPNAPPELSRFAFLIGKFRCEVRLKQGDGDWASLKGTWEGHFILDGYAIEDEYRMTTVPGELVVLGMNFRSYDAKKKSWNIKWLNALSGTWVDLGTEELGGVKIDEKGITYKMKEPVASHTFTRATYTNISENHFTWRGERSNDEKAWEEFMVIEAERVKN
jgi:hypothetical protein